MRKFTPEELRALEGATNMRLRVLKDQIANPDISVEARRVIRDEENSLWQAIKVIQEANRVH